MLRRAVTGLVVPEFTSLTHRINPKLTSERPLETTYRPISRLYDVIVDVSSEPLNEWFNIQVDAVYWNVFLDPPSRWVGIPVQFSTGSIRFELTSPTKPFAAFERRAYERNSTPGNNNIVNEPTAEMRLNNTMIIWKIEHPNRNWIYEIKWEW